LEVSLSFGIVEEISPPLDLELGWFGSLEVAIRGYEEVGIGVDFYGEESWSLSYAGWRIFLSGACFLWLVVDMQELEDEPDGGGGR